MNKEFLEKIKLLWLDIETTGLDENLDDMLERRRFYS